MLKNPYPKTFYPGTQNLENAATIIILEGQVLKNLDFRLPPQMTERKIEGIVVFPDGKPVANAHIIVEEGEYRDDGGVAESGPDGRFSLTVFRGLDYKLRAYVSFTSGEQRHAEPINIPTKGNIKNFKIVISEPGGSCAKCR